MDKFAEPLFEGRYIQLWSHSDAIAADIHDSVDPKMAWVRTHNDPGPPSWPLRHPPLLVISDQPPTSELLELTISGPTLMWLFDQPRPTQAEWVRLWTINQWGDAMEALDEILHRSLGDIRLSATGGLCNTSGRWFQSQALEALIAQHPLAIPLTEPHKRSVRKTLKGYSEGKLGLSCTNLGARCILLGTDHEQN